MDSRTAGAWRGSLPAPAGRVSTPHPHQRPARSAQHPDERLPPQVRLLLTAFAPWAVRTGFVTGRDGAPGLCEGRWQELLVLAAAALPTCWGDRARGGARR